MGESSDAADNQSCKYEQAAQQQPPTDGTVRTMNHEVRGTRTKLAIIVGNADRSAASERQLPVAAGCSRG